MRRLRKEQAQNDNHNNQMRKIRNTSTSFDKRQHQCIELSAALRKDRVSELARNTEIKKKKLFARLKHAEKSSAIYSF